MSSPSMNGDTPTGLPGPLPDGETILWQGAPAARSFARRALHVRGIAIYFALGAVVAALRETSAGAGWAGAVGSVAVIMTAGALVIGFAALIAWATSRTTVYTITNRRVVMRIGIALSVTLNFPFAAIEGAGLKVHPDGTGDIPLALTGNGRIGYLHLWPHARPWWLSRPQPMLRSIPDAGKVAAILTRALGGGSLGRAAANRPPARPVGASETPSTVAA